MSDTAPHMDVASFIAKWKRTQLSERAASQEHFIDLCQLLGQPTPAEHDATGAEYAFEKNVAVSGPASRGTRGSHGFADVWWKGRFGWEYKRKDKYATLEDAYRQLTQYREALDNPPLLIVSDIARTEIHTNFTGYRKVVHVIELEQLHEEGQLELLRRVFTDPGSFKPDQTAEQVTADVAKEIGTIAHGLRARGHDPHDAAHFLMKVMFCLFAEDVALLPKGLFAKLLERSQRDPARLKQQMDRLFAAMRTGGDFGVDEIDYFNGGLFDDSEAIELTEEETASLIRAATQDWGSVEPAVFGTLFERSLDPSKRAQIGAHYTSREDIMLVIEPVIVRPLRREWDGVRTKCEALVKERSIATREEQKGARKKGELKSATFTKRIERELLDFQDRLAKLRVLDPACGSGNFLYVAIQQLLALEKAVIVFAADAGSNLIPRVRPTQLHGIEINTYAAELAQVVIWIGYLQWMRDNGFNAPRDPILEPIESIEHRDAILAWADETGASIPTWREGAACLGQAKWPEADFIVGNPPFLGTKMLRGSLGDGYVESLFEAFDGTIPGFSDLCCYWIELASQATKKRPVLRVGLLSTQAIRNTKARVVLERVQTHSTIFDAWADEEWVLDGAAVHISIVCFTGSNETTTHLDGRQVDSITASLSAGVDSRASIELAENEDVGFIGDMKGGPFALPFDEARPLLATPTPNGESPFQVVRPQLIATDIVRRARGQWIVDFGVERSLTDSASFGAPFEWIERNVKPAREAGRPTRPEWWLHMRPGPSMRAAVAPLARFIATGNVAKHRVFVWHCSPTLPDHAVTVFARADDYFFGALHASIHELWALRQGTQLESRPRYTPTTCFETFPLPWAPGKEPAAGDPQRALHDAIADAARTLNEQRERWLNPPEWIEAITARIDAEDDFADVARVSGEEARRLIRQSAIDAAAAQDPKLKKRTLTNLYNERPTWLRLAHKALDEAVLAAYAAIDPAGAWDTAWADVFVETGAGQPLPGSDDDTPHPMTAQREEVEQAILANLLRLNHERSKGNE